MKAQCSSFSSGSFWTRSLFSCALRFLHFEQVFSKWAVQIAGGIFNFFCSFIFVCRTLISRLSPAGFAILDGAGWIAADTGHTMGAAVAPGRCSVFYPDVAQRTGLLTSAAANAAAGTEKGFGFHADSIKHIVDEAGLQLVCDARLVSRKSPSFADTGNPSFQHRLRISYNFAGFVLLGSVEHDDVIFRHDHLQSPQETEPNFFAERLVFWLGVADFTAAGHDKISVFAAQKAAAANEIHKKCMAAASICAQ